MHSQEEINQAKSLWKLDRWKKWYLEVRGWREGDWCLYEDKIYLVVSETDTLVKVILEYERRHTFRFYFKYDCTPLPSFADMRSFLREEGIYLNSHDKLAIGQIVEDICQQ